MERADAILANLFAGRKAPAMSAAVARPDGLLWAGALGMADIELDVAATPHHRFRLGSVSKVLTSTAAAMLASRRRIELHAPISIWLPDVPEQHRETTLEQLLTHRAGIRHYLPRDFDPASPGGSVFNRRYPDREAILALFIDDPLVAAPGTSVSYSTFGYSLASLAMEAAANTPFTRLIRSEIGDPFDLPSLAEDDPQAIIPGRVRGYANVGDMHAMLPQQAAKIWPGQTEGWASEPAINPSYSWAGAGFLMTMPDLARFGAALVESPHARIDAKQRRLLFTPLTAATSHSPPLGLGWRVDSDASGRLRWHHAGATPGGRAGLVVYPDLALSIALAGNVMTAPGDILGPSSNLADAFS